MLANRIPRFARLVLRVLLARLAAPLPLKAIQKHAWTFAGTGQCLVAPGPNNVVTISDNPVTMAGRSGHIGVLEVRFRVLVSPRQACHSSGFTADRQPCLPVLCLILPNHVSAADPDQGLSDPVTLGSRPRSLWSAMG